MKKNFFLNACLPAFLMLAVINTASAQDQNDHIFPPAKAASAAINFDSRGFLVHGKRTFIVSAGLEYARIPHELWADRLLRLKRAGFNCIEIYTLWNFHEPAEGRFDFAGDHDLDAFLKLVKKMDLYAIVRVGPYYCAEWDMGGYPVWLRFKNNLLLRQPNAAFIQATGNFFDKLIPIISRNQINHGGAVIMVQLENEHPKGWGTVMPDSYFRFLQTKALALGLQVPYFFSGLHHGSDPAENKSSLDDTGRPNPWMSTEFWSVWYNYYSSTQKDADIYGRRTWKIIAHGGNGYNYYMAHGGSNFGFTNSNEDAASYDYGAAVGQTGDLRPVYYQFKRNALFARSFETILENSKDGGKEYSYLSTDTALHITSRKSPVGDLVFLDNPGKTMLQEKLSVSGEQLPEAAGLELKPGEIIPVVHNYQLAPGVVIDWSFCRILGITRQGNTTTLVVYGDINEYAELLFTPTKPTRLVANAGDFNQVKEKIRLNFQFAPLTPKVYAFRAGSELIRILALNTELADRSWFITTGGKDFVVTGPEYVSSAALEGNRLRLGTEHFLSAKNVYPTWVYGESIDESMQEVKNYRMVSSDSLSFSAAWKVKPETGPAANSFNDAGWKKSIHPEQMGADGDLTPDCWYRSKVKIDTAGLYTLSITKGGDRVIVYIDGSVANSGQILHSALQLMLSTGEHRLVLFVSHDGRDKLYDHLGAFGGDEKGIAGTVSLMKGKLIIPVTGWAMKGGQGDYINADGYGTVPATRIQGPAFYRNTFLLSDTSASNTPVWRVSFDGLSHGSVYLNGHNIGRYPEKIPVGTMYLPEPWLRKGLNSLVVFDEDGEVPGKIRIRSEKASARIADIAVIDLHPVILVK